MIKQGTVKQAKYLGRTWEAHGKTFFVHGIAFDNNDFGEYSSVNEHQTKFVVGQTRFYELAGEPGKIKIKPADDPNDPYGGWTKSGLKEYTPKPDDKNRGFALSYAKDITIGRMEREEGYNFDELELLQLADTFNNWLNNFKPEVTEAPQSREVAEEPPNFNPEDKLPF